MGGRFRASALFIGRKVKIMIQAIDIKKEKDEKFIRAKYAMTKEEYAAFGEEWDKIRFEILKLLKGRSIPIVKGEK